MLLTIPADASNTKNIPSILAEMGYPIPCNCYGAHRCNGRRYPFDCSLIPKEPITIHWEPENSSLHGLSFTNEPQNTNRRGDTILIDIGTTTIAIALISCTAKAILRHTTFANPQRSFGTDVISRILSACQGMGEQLRSTLIDAINEETDKLCSNNQQKPEEITACYIGGNTTMIHLLMGFDCTPLSHAPFLPEAESPRPFYYNQCKVIPAPWFSGFVGGDIYAGLFTCRSQLSAHNDSFVFLDLGTNGEIVLCHEGILYVTSTAAGPAFEGGNLSCGCASIPGAICNVIIRRLRPQLKTIENKMPVGLCGSGAISLCAELLRKKYITKDGILTVFFPPEGYFLGQTPDGSRLMFTADDFRNIQLAIAAIAAGIDTLLEQAHITPEQVSHIFLGGGFGFHISKQDCETLGLFSDLDGTNLHVIGNSCLKGLMICATEQLPMSAPQSFVPVNLAEQTGFERKFMQHMSFPDI